MNDSQTISGLVLFRSRNRDAFEATRIERHTWGVVAVGAFRRREWGGMYYYGAAESYSWPWREISEIREGAV
jgi:hypothetical protein